MLTLFDADARNKSTTTGSKFQISENDLLLLGILIFQLIKHI